AADRAGTRSARCRARASPARAIRAGWQLGDLDLDVFAFDSNVVAADSPSRWRPQNLAGGDVEAGAVKGTGHHRAVHLPLGEGASTVRAGVVDGVQRAGHVEERHRLSFDVDGDRRPGRDVLRRGNLDE